MPRPKLRAYPEINSNTDAEAGSSFRAMKPRAAISADRVMRFCCPKGAVSSPQTLDMTDLENWPPFRISDANGLPLFGDLTRYGATTKRQRRLWDLEIRRLLRETGGVPSHTLAPKLRSEGHQMLLQSPIDSMQIDRLQEIADQLLHCLHVCVADDQQLLTDSVSQFERSKGTNSYRELQKVSTVDNELPGQYEETHLWTYAGNNDADEEQSSRGLTYSARAKEVEDSEIEDYHCIVDQITATIARLAILGNDSQYWHVVVLACLAKLSTKLKFLVPNIVENISKSLKQNIRLKFGPDSESEDSNDNGGNLTDRSPTIHRYCTEFDVVTSWLVDSATFILKDLGARRPWELRSDHLDMCTLVYLAGIPGTRTIFHQGRGQSISGSPSALPVEFSSSALKLTNELATTHLSTTSSEGCHSTNSATGNNTLRISLTFESVELLEDNFQLSQGTWHLVTMIDLVLISAPISMSCPAIGCGFETSLRTISALSAFGKASFPATNKMVSAFASLKPNLQPHDEAEKEFSSLSDSLLATMRHNTLERRCPTSLSANRRPPPRNISPVLTAARREREQLKQVIDDWAIQETSIIIKCTAYVNFMMSLSAILVIGGLLCGFLVGERIPGVDPFNLTMFSWIVGGFVLLIAKSVRVSNWTWRDLLLRQVTCRSVSEVSSITGLDAQHILVFLLSSEFKIPLGVGGPYCGPFHYNPGADEFSIDVKPTLQTLLASGIIPVMVSTLGGPVLMQIRVVPGVENWYVHTRGRSVPSSVYLEFPDFGEKGDAMKIHKSLSWVKVLGFYNSTQTSFR